MSFSGRRVSILRPSSRRFSQGKELSENGSLPLRKRESLIGAVTFAICDLVEHVEGQLKKKKKRPQL
jgi:hypothetical protein